MMFKKTLSMLLTLCLLAAAVPAALMEEDAAALFEEEEVLAGQVEAVLEDSEVTLGEAQAEADEVPADAPPATDETPATDEPSATDEIPATGEAPADEAPVEATPVEETSVEETPSAEAEAPAAELPAENPAEPTPAAVETPPDTTAQIASEAAMEGAIGVFLLTKSAKTTMTMGDFLLIDLNGKVAKSFKSSRTSVAVVDQNGLIAAVGGGKAKITVTLTNKKKLTLTLTVVDPTVPTAVCLTMDAVTPLSGTITAYKGVPFALLPVAAAPAGVANTGYKWSTSNKKVATVANGVVTPKKVGSATITVKTTRGGKKAKVKVKVVDPFKATAVYMNKTGLVYMTAKSTMQLYAAMEPVYSTSTLKWSSSNKSVATVNQNGLVTAKKKGTATITVKTSSGKKARVKVKVYPQAGAAKSMIAEWSMLDADNTLNPGDLYTYVISMSPLNATADVVWASDNNDVIRVENFYRGDDLRFLCEVRAVDLGRANLVALDTVTGFSQAVKLIVKPGSEPQSIEFPGLNNSNMKVGEKRDILYQVNPQDSLSHDANRAVVNYDHSILSITYDPNNADRNCRGTMDYYLHVTAVGTGTTTVSVHLKNGVTAAFVITVV